MDRPLILALLSGSLMIIDELYTEYFIKHGYGEEGNPLMKNKTVRILSIPLALLAIGGAYSITKIFENTEVSPFISAIISGSFLITSSITGTVIFFNIRDVERKKKRIEEVKNNG